MNEEIIEKLKLLLQGGTPEPVSKEDINEESQIELIENINQLFSFTQQIQAFIVPLAKGAIDEVLIPPKKNFLASPFKELHSRLTHLIWQAKQVSQGDYSQRVDFMGEFSTAFNAMIIALDEREKQLKREIAALEKAKNYIHNLEGILPVCSSCKKIRLEDTDGHSTEDWVNVDKYLHQKGTRVSHGICPECIKKLYPDL